MSDKCFNFFKKNRSPLNDVRNHVLERYYGGADRRKRCFGSASDRPTLTPRLRGSTRVLVTSYMPPRIGLALVLCFVFPCLVLGVDILMDPHGNGSLFFSASFTRRSSVDTVDIHNKKVITSQTQLICWSRFWFFFFPLVWFIVLT
jgi:hypothetical protein